MGPKKKKLNRFTLIEQAFMATTYQKSTVREIADVLGRRFGSVNNWLIGHGYRQKGVVLKNDYEKTSDLLDKLFAGSEYNRIFRDLPDPKGRFPNVDRFNSKSR